MANIRGLEILFADFDRRQRPDARSRNRPISKYAQISDVVVMKEGVITITIDTPPYHWHDPAGNTATSLRWGRSEWRA